MKKGRRNKTSVYSSVLFLLLLFFFELVDVCEVMPRRKGHGIPPTKRVKQPSSSDITSSSNPKSSSSPVKSKTPDCNDNSDVATREDSDQMSVESSPAKSETSTVTHSKYLHKKFKKMATAVFTPEENVSQFANTLNGSRVKGVLCSVPSKLLSDSEKVDVGKVPTTTVSSGNMSVRVTSPPGGVGRYVCPYCKLACAKPSVLQKHIRAHTNERPYPCLPCGFAFKTKSNLYKHCRSRAHALKMEETGDETGGKFNIPMEEEADSTSDEDELQSTKQPAVSLSANQISVSETNIVEERPVKTIYKPKFHTASKYLDKMSQSGKPEERKENTSSPPHLQLKIPTSTPHSSLSTPSPFTSGSSPSPEFLHRHINKLISENQAIVETMDPFWPKKFLQRTNSRDNRDSNNSPASPVSSSSSPTDVILPRRYTQRQNNMGIDNTSNLQENSGSNDTDKFSSKYNIHSKLALALLRPQVPTSPRLNSSSPVDVLLDSQPLNLTTNSNKSEQPPPTHHNRKRCYSEGFPNVRANRDKITNLPLRINNNNQANLDHSKLNFISSDTNFPVLLNHSDGKKSSGNPQNPEGSIIKDLLLKARAASAAGIPIITSGHYGAAVNELIGNVKSGNFLLSVTPPVPDDRAYSPSNQFMCHLCKVPYRSAENLEIHQLYYCKGSEVITRSPLHSPSPQTAEVLQVQVPTEYPSKTNLGSRKEYSSMRRGDPPMLIAPSHPSPGPLLGNTPLVESYHTKIRSDQDTPPIKKQKFEEISHSLSPELRAVSATTLRSLEELSKCPMRTNTLQMFGGEVKILDNPGGETKTMRIEPLNRATPQTPTDLSLNIPSQSSVGSKSFSKDQNENKDSCPQIVVTIAKTGLHSGGGTIVQVPQKIVPTEGIQQQMSGCTMTSALSPHGVSGSNYTEQNKLIIPIIPNIVAPNLSIPGIPAPVQLPFVPFTPILTEPSLLNPLTNITAYNPLTLPPASLLCQPTSASPYTGGIVTILHGGKEIPYVPGMPGPHTLVTANPSLQPFGSSKAPDIQRLHESSIPSKSNVPIISHDARSVPIKSEKVQNNCDVSKPNQSGVSVLKVKQPAMTLNIPSIQLTADTELPVEQTTNSNIRKRSRDETTVVRTVASPKLVLNRKNVHSPVVGTEVISVSTNNEDTVGSDRTDIFSKLEKRFLRPTSLPLKPGTYTPKRQLSVANNVLSLVSPETPRPRKSYGQLYLNGHAYTYLGLKCSTKLFNCTLNKTQPIYVPLSPEHNKVSMYSNWKVCSEADPNPFGLDPGKAMAHYDSRHRPTAYTLACSKSNYAVTHSTYWNNRTATKQLADAIKREKSDTAKQDSNSKSEAGTENSVPKRVKIFVGGFESNEDYIYVRGRGRGRYVCEECGIRCKKPSMLKKHIRTHTDVRPFTCVHCKFSFKTKGNLTKHMKSKAHYKKCIELGITPVPTVVDDSCVDESILARQQALRADQDYDPEESEDDEDEDDDDDEDEDDEEEEEEAEEWKCRLEREAARSLLTLSETIQSATQRQYADAGLVAISARPNTYPYSFTMCCTAAAQPQTPTLTTITAQREREKVSHNTGLAREVHCSTKHAERGTVVEEAKGSSTLDVGVAARYYFPGDRRDSELDSGASFRVIDDETTSDDSSVSSFKHSSTLPMDLSNKTPVDTEPVVSKPVVRVCEAAMLLASLCSTMERLPVTCSATVPEDSALLQAYLTERAVRESRMKQQQYKVTSSKTDSSSHLKSFIDSSKKTVVETDSIGENNQTEILAKATTTANSIEMVAELQTVTITTKSSIEPVKTVAPSETENAALLAAKENVLNALTQASSDVRKLPALTISSSATTTAPIVTAAGPVSKKLKAEFMPPSSGPSPSYVSLLEDGRSMCVICNKVFTKPSQLRLHVNIHYFERPFRCESCAVSFRTNGHLQKHQRSVSHLNKVSMNSTFGAATTTNPRPFKCDDCKIAFRIHGHLAKHLRSKMHIMKLECLGKLPFGTYAEMERSGINMNDIDTTDCENSLESLQMLAQKLYEKDPSKLGQWDPLEMMPQLNQQLSSGDTSDEDEEGMACMSPPANKIIEQPAVTREQAIVNKTMMVSPVLRYQSPPIVHKQMFLQQQQPQQRNVEPVKYIMNLNNNSAQVFRHKPSSVSNVVLLTDANDLVGHAQFSKTETGNPLVVSSNSGNPLEVSNNSGHLGEQSESRNSLVIVTTVSESVASYEECCSAAGDSENNQRTARDNKSEQSVTDDSNSVQLKQSLGELETSTAENQNNTTTTAATTKNENLKTKDIRSYEYKSVDGKTD